MLPLKDQLTGAGFEVLFTCDTEDCGGFDFRFATDVLPPPDMQVDLGDFRYLAALRPSADGPEAISLLVSRSSRAGYVQVVHVSRATAEEPVAAPDAAPLLAPDSPDIPTDFAGQLDTLGRVVMADLAFESGSSDLGEGDFPSLQKLADYLAANPDRRVALVGHTDSSGTLDGNIALSKRRAVSVLERLVADYGVQRSQIEAEGMGYLSPLASNLTPEGREINRRVEVIVVSTE
jgi:OOP family OmpA-OmpF porin